MRFLFGLMVFLAIGFVIYAIVVYYKSTPGETVFKRIVGACAAAGAALIAALGAYFNAPPSLP